MDPAIIASFHEFMTQGKFTDVSFVIGKVSSLRAHKIVLAAYSPVFRAMFETDMLESKTHQVVLTDVSKADFRAFLDFLYTGDMKYLEDRLPQMYRLADKYNVQCLEVACDEFVIKNLSNGPSTTTILNYLLLLDSLERLETKKIVMGYIRQNLSSIMSGDEWKTLLDHPSLLREVVRTVVADERPLRGSETKWSIVLDSKLLSRIEKKENFEGPLKDGSKGSSKYLIIGKDKVNISISFKSVNGRVHAELKVKKEKVPEGKAFFLSIESFAQLAMRNFSSNQTTVKIEGSRPFALDLVVFEHNGLMFKEPVTIFVEAKLLPPTQVTSAFKPTEKIRHRFSDAVILTKQGRFPVHKVILAGRSSFFDELFRENSQEYRIEIEDLTERSFELLMDFIYSGHHPDYETEDVTELLIGAHKFQLEDVVNKCIPLLDAKISCDNAVNLLKKGDTMNIDPLKSAALRYLIRNKTLVKNLGELETHPELLKEVLLKMIEEPQDQ